MRRSASLVPVTLALAAYAAANAVAAGPDAAAPVKAAPAVPAPATATPAAPDVPPGPAPGTPPTASNEPKLNVPGREGEYLRAMHTVIHFRWATKFIDWVANKRPPKDKLNDMTLATEILFNLRWDGSPGQ